MPNINPTPIHHTFTSEWEPQGNQENKSQMQVNGKNKQKNVSELGFSKDLRIT